MKYRIALLLSCVALFGTPAFSMDEGDDTTRTSLELVNPKAAALRARGYSPYVFPNPRDPGVHARLGKLLDHGSQYLISLTLHSLGITDDDIRKIVVAFPNLTLLDVSRNNVGNLGVAAIAAHLTALTDLDLSDNLDITEIDPLTGLSLRRLNLRMVPTGNGAVAVLASLPTLTWLDVSRPALGRTTHPEIDAAGVAPLAHLTALTSLNMNNHRIKSGVSFLTSLTNLRELGLAKSGLGGEEVAVIAAHLTALTSLDLSMNYKSPGYPLNDGNIKPLTHLTALTKLNLPRNGITWKGLKRTLKGLLNLTELDVSGNPLFEGDRSADIRDRVKIHNTYTNLATLILAPGDTRPENAVTIEAEMASLEGMSEAGLRDPIPELSDVSSSDDEGAAPSSNGDAREQAPLAPTLNDVSTSEDEEAAPSPNENARGFPEEA